MKTYWRTQHDFLQKRNKQIKPQVGQVWKGAYDSGWFNGDAYEIIHVAKDGGFVPSLIEMVIIAASITDGRLNAGIGFSITLLELSKEAPVGVPGMSEVAA